MFAYVYFLFFFLFLGQAFGQEVPGMCAVEITVNCVDCEEGEEFTGEIYRFMVDERGQMAHNPHLKSGDLISSGRADPGRRTLVINDEEVYSVGCVSGADRLLTISFSIHGDEGVVYVPAEEPVRVGRPIITAPDFPPVAAPPVPEPVPSLVGPLPVVEPPPARPTPTVTVTRVDPPAERVEGSVVAQNVGWGAPGTSALWLGNDGDYPSARSVSRRGHFMGPEHHCPEGTIPLVQGTAAQIAGGILGQVALDDRRATDVAPPDWSGEYVGPTGTTILGKDAAGIFCVEPHSIIRREPAVMAAVIQPPAPPGVTLEDLEALRDQLREELKPPPEVEPPPPVAVPETKPTFKLIERYGPFGALIRNESEEGGLLYVHGVGGGFITFNLYKDRVGFEPYFAVGGDGESTHPCSYNEQGDLTWCSGWYPSIYWGARVPVRLVKFWKFQLHAFAGVGVVQDDINEGFHVWGQLTQYTGGLEVRFVGFKSIKPALSLEAGGSSVSYLNGSLTHTTGSAWVLAPNLKVGF